MLHNKTAHMLMAGVAFVAMSAQASAQDATDAEKGGLADIVVTAQKRATNIQDTPIAIRAFDGEAIAKAGVTDVNGLARLAPDLGITTDTIFTKIAIRGVSSVDISETSDPALTIGIDGEYINRPVALNASFFDLERIEVLRGPQGTLYGRNSTAGALNIVAAKPKLGEFGGFVTAGYGNYDAKMMQGAVNVPLGEVAAIRVAGLHTDHDGYTDNSPAGHGDTANVDAARASIAFEPSGGLSVYVAGEYVNVDQTAPSQFGLPVSAASSGLVQLAQPNPAFVNPLSYTTPAGVDLTPGFDRGAFPLGNLGLFKTEQYAIRGRIAYDFGPATLSYLAGYRDVSVNSVQPLNGFLPEMFTFYNPKLDSKTQSHEIRLNGGDEGKFVWQVGAFYFKETQDIARGLFLPLAAGGSYLNYFYRDVKSTSKAGFAQATYWLTPDVFSITAGIRYTDDKKSGVYTNFGGQFGRGSTPPPITDTTRPGYRRFSPTPAKSDQFTWNLGIDFKPADDSLLYAKVSKGYKGGGFDNVGSFDPEQLIAYEIGSKNRFLDRTLEFNASAFYYDYTDQQIQVFIDTSVGARTLNAGKSRVWGIETDTTILLSENDRFKLTANYIDAKLTNFPGVPVPVLANPPAGQSVLTTNLGGNRPPQAPRITIALGYDHTFHLGDYRVIASAFSRFKSDYYLTAFNFAGDRQSAYTNTDLSLELLAPDDRFSVQAYVHNVEDYRPKTYAAFTGGGINIYNFIFGAPRTYGVQGTFKF